MTRKKRARLKKQRKLHNKRLLKRYPWLRPDADWYTGRILKDYNYEWTWLDSFPSGWYRAFGKMMLNELDAAIRRGGLLNRYHIDEVKEKYGQLRWYHSGFNDEIEQIVDKYSHISESVCICCGKPDVKMTNAGWIIPMCKRCFEKNVNTTWTYEEVTSDKDDGKIASSYTIRHFNNEGTTDTVYDISDTAKAVRDRYERSNRRLR